MTDVEGDSDDFVGMVTRDEEPQSVPSAVTAKAPSPGETSKWSAVKTMVDQHYYC